MYKDNQGGFTLVELAIVMIIIGLLIGGVLKGQELILNAQTTRVIAQIKSYKTAFRTFRGMYNELPGDMTNARRRLPGCAADALCLNGDGNLIVGTNVAGNHVITQAGITSRPEVETTMFWKHMALANVIGEVDATAAPTATAWGSTHPRSAMRGGYQVFFYTGASNFVGVGHKIRWQNHLTGNIPFGTRGAHVIDPIRAWNIDIKIDDGAYHAGDVMSDSESGGCGTGALNYANTRERNCIMYFNLD